MLTFVLAAVAIATWVAAMRYRAAPLVAARAGDRARASVIPAQAVLGGFTVLTDLNPWVVALHLLLSLAMVAVAVVFVRRIDEDDQPPRPTVPRPVVAGWPGRCSSSTWVVLYVGTVVTGSGPHAGRRGLAADRAATRETVSQVHADLVFLLVGLTDRHPGRLRRRAARPTAPCAPPRGCSAIELAQGLIGFVQYFTDLPGRPGRPAHARRRPASVAAATWMLLGTRDRGLVRT